MEWHSYGLTHKGNIRDHNEDAFLDAGDKNTWVVADGMGGHKAGDLASKALVESIKQFQNTVHLGKNIRLLQTIISKVNAQLYSQSNNGTDIMGSTITILHTVGSYAVFLWVGDSRVYRLRNQKLSQITRDHSESERLTAEGISKEEIDQYPYADALSKAVGGEPNIEIETITSQIQEDDIFVLCSDGLYKELTDTDIEAIANENHQDVQKISEVLFHLALNREGKDNITVLTIKCRTESVFV